MEKVTESKEEWSSNDVIEDTGKPYCHNLTGYQIITVPMMVLTDL